MSTKTCDRCEELQKRLEAAEVLCEAAENVYGIEDVVCTCNTMNHPPCGGCTGGLLDLKAAFKGWREGK